jgi:hypothetical protein
LRRGALAPGGGRSYVIETGVEIEVTGIIRRC